MNLVSSVYELAESFMKDSKDVFINNENVTLLGNKMLKEGKTDFPLPYTENPYKAVLIELIASSINYCYWYGRGNIRPNNCSSTHLYDCIANAFFDYKEQDYQHFNLCLTRLINLLISHRFPLVEERMYHLNQLRCSGEEYSQRIIDSTDTYDINDLMLELITLFPGFSSDLFLKRTFLFFMQMYRRFGWFEQSMKNIPVAADYQVPKILEHLKCIRYSSPLRSNIKFSTLIPKGSREECEIRSATVLVCKELCKLTGWNIADVDGYLWLQRKKVSTPFHLTITTDY